MLCPICGYARPGDADSCPSCGRGFLEADAATPVRKPRFDPVLVRVAVYAALLFGVAKYFGSLYSHYLDAEQSRLESVLLGQVLEHKKAVQEAADQ